MIDSHLSSDEHSLYVLAPTMIAFYSYSYYVLRWEIGQTEHRFLEMFLNTSVVDCSACERELTVMVCVFLPGGGEWERWNFTVDAVTVALKEGAQVGEGAFF